MCLSARMTQQSDHAAPDDHGVQPDRPPADVPVTPHEQLGAAGGTWVQHPTNSERYIGPFRVSNSSSAASLSPSSLLSQDSQLKLKALNSLFEQCDPQQLQAIINHLSSLYEVSQMPE
jgi:hypothetical protein